MQLKGSAGMIILKGRLKKAIEDIESESDSLLKMGGELEQIIKVYTAAENRIVNYVMGR